MACRIRREHEIMSVSRCALAAGLAALISAQATYAAPPVRGALVDPLVALSVFGTAQSRAAVCASGTNAAVAGSAAATAQGVTAPACVLPVTAPPAPAPSAQAAPVPFAPAPAKSVQPLLMTLLGVAALVGFGALLLSGDDEEQPVSPA